jgi:hypothetical protein
LQHRIKPSPQLLRVLSKSLAHDNGVGRCLSARKDEATGTRGYGAQIAQGRIRTAGLRRLSARAGKHRGQRGTGMVPHPRRSLCALCPATRGLLRAQQGMRGRAPFYGVSGQSHRCPRPSERKTTRTAISSSSRGGSVTAPVSPQKQPSEHSRRCTNIIENARFLLRVRGFPPLITVWLEVRVLPGPLRFIWISDVCASFVSHRPQKRPQKRLRSCQ